MAPAIRRPATKEPNAVPNVSAHPRRRAAPRAPLHCGVLAEGRYLAQAQPRGLMQALAADGHRVTLIDSGAAVLDVGDGAWLDDLDVLVARGRSPELLARLGLAEEAGIPTPNQRRAIASVLDKAYMAAALRASGIPMPATWIGGIEQLRRDIPAWAYPLVVKPVFGDNCRGVRIVDSRAALQEITWAEPCAIAQRFVANDGFDVKLYVIGEHVAAMRKPSPLHGTAGNATPLQLPAAWRELAWRCGDVFGLHLFGVDCIECGGELVVIEVNDFPNYTGVPGADARLAAHVLEHAHARRQA